MATFGTIKEFASKKTHRRDGDYVNTFRFYCRFIFDRLTKKEEGGKQGVTSSGVVVNELRVLEFPARELRLKFEKQKY